MKSGPERDLIAGYTSRLPWNLSIKEVDLRGKLDPATRLERETAGLIEFIASADYVIALDERGKSLGTRTFATRLQSLELRGDVKTIAFLIGASDGHNEHLRSECDELLTLSPFTLQHELALLVLLEQLYRVASLKSGSPYHRD